METLTDAVRATLSHIAAVRLAPRHPRGPLYTIAAALGSGRGWHDTMEEFDRALNYASEESRDLGTALGASLGRSRILKFEPTRKSRTGQRRTGSSSPR